MTKPVRIASFASAPEAMVFAARLGAEGIETAMRPAETLDPSPIAAPLGGVAVYVAPQWVDRANEILTEPDLKGVCSESSDALAEPTAAETTAAPAHVPSIRQWRMLRATLLAAYVPLAALVAFATRDAATLVVFCASYVAALIAVHLRVVTLRCPRCGRRIVQGPRGAAHWAPRECMHCALEL